MFTPYMSPPYFFDVTYLNTESFILCIPVTSRLTYRPSKFSGQKGKQTFIFLGLISIIWGKKKDIIDHVIPKNVCKMCDYNFKTWQIAFVRVSFME